jgi:hypothetical protein
MAVKNCYCPKYKEIENKRTKLIKKEKTKFNGTYAQFSADFGA